MSTPDPATPAPASTGKARFLVALAGTAGLSMLITALLTTIFEHKEDARNPYIRFVNVTEETTDPAPWGIN